MRLRLNIEAGSESVRLIAAILASCLALGAWAPVQAQSGIPAASPVGPFLNDVFPPTTPQSGSGWKVEDANGVSVSNTLVIAANPADEDAETDRLYTAARNGYIESFLNDASAASKVLFMDLRDRVAVVTDGGFLGMAFHPEFGQADSPYSKSFYVYYSSHCPYDQANDQVDTNNCVDFPTDPAQQRDLVFFDVYLRLSRFEVIDENPVNGILQGDLNSEDVLVNIRLYNSTHRGGGPVFGLDGNLYLAIGDQRRWTTAQDIENNFEGGVMRLAVDVVDHGDGTWSCPAGSHPPTRRMQEIGTFNGVPTDDEVTGRKYCIPDDNPFINDPATPNAFHEYYTLGHRNPHRISVDRESGRVWVGEVGESTREEINVLCSGCNFGWPFREGLIQAPDGRYNTPPDPIIGTLTDPVIDFTRDEARAIIGGYVYRGSRFPELYGRYIAGDFVYSTIWAIHLDPDTMTATKQALTNFTPQQLATFGEDNWGELYLGDVQGAHPLQRLAVIGAPAIVPPALLSQTGAFANLPLVSPGGPAELQPSPGVIPYDLINPLWSDGALKYRWLVIPNDGTPNDELEQIAFSEEGPWAYPIGSVFIKHFELPSDPYDPNPQTARPTETRFLVHGEDGVWYGLTYAWKSDGSDAVLVGTDTLTESITVTDTDHSTTYSWDYPGRTLCSRCHTSQEYVLGPKTRQLNLNLDYGDAGVPDGSEANQVETLDSLGFLHPSLAEAGVNLATTLTSASLDDTSATLEHRARSYLDSNCAGCHRGPNGAAGRASWDGRLLSTLALQDAGIVGGSVVDDLGDPATRVVTPGDLDLSSLFLRLESVDPAIMMVPLAKHIADPDAVSLFQDWILAMGNEPPALQRPIDRTSNVGAYAELQLEASDPNGDPITYRAQNLPPGLSIDAVTGLISGTPTTEGNYEVTVTADDSYGAEDNETFNWSVVDPFANTPPSVTNPGNQQSIAGETVSLFIDASDPDAAQTLSYGAAGLPPGLDIDAETGEISGTIALHASGTYEVLVTVSDGIVGENATFTWVVNEDTSPPTQPTDLTAQAVGSSQIDLSWTAATDNVGVDHYCIYRDPAYATPVCTTTAAATSFSDTGLAASTTYRYEVAAYDLAGNESARSDAASATTESESSGEWLNQDVGAVQAAGSYSESGGTFTVRGSGADIHGTADEFHYVYRELTGDGEIRARMKSLELKKWWTRGGVMLRADPSAAGAQNVMMAMTPQGTVGAVFQYRQLAGGITRKVRVDAAFQLPEWVRLVRAGETVTGYVSEDGTTWTPMGSVTLPGLPATIYAGLAVTSLIDGTLTTAEFDNVTAQ